VVIDDGRARRGGRKITSSDQPIDRPPDQQIDHDLTRSQHHQIRFSQLN
jgi:hypothetical protein